MWIPPPTLASLLVALTRTLFNSKLTYADVPGASGAAAAASTSSSSSMGTIKVRGGWEMGNGKWDDLPIRA